MEQTQTTDQTQATTWALMAIQATAGQIVMERMAFGRTPRLGCSATELLAFAEALCDSVHNPGNAVVSLIGNARSILERNPLADLGYVEPAETPVEPVVEATPVASLDHYAAAHQALTDAISSHGITSKEAAEADKALWAMMRISPVVHIAGCVGETGRSNWATNCTCSLAPALTAHFGYKRDLKATKLAVRSDVGAEWLGSIDGNQYERIARALTPSGITTIQFRQNLSGCHKASANTIQAPRPVTRKALQVYLHECAHSVLHTGIRSSSTGIPKAKGWEYVAAHPKYIWEYQAEQWSFEAMRLNKVPVPAESIARAKAYVLRLLEQAIKGGVAVVDREIAEWCGFPVERYQFSRTKFVKSVQRPAWIPPTVAK